MSKPKILVVEDSPTMRQLILMALRRVREVETDEAVDGVEGLKKLKAGNYAMLITDINMPIMDGLKLVSLVRQDERHAGIPIIIITTEGGAEDRARAMSLGANAYITKPIQAQAVQSKVKELLQLV
jgi:two-component system, chemotaxis family, chemotaxis protein CheY